MSDIADLSIKQKNSFGAKQNTQQIDVHISPKSRYNNLSHIPDIDIIFDSHLLRSVIEQCWGKFVKTDQKENYTLNKTIIPLEEKHILNNFCSDFWDECVALDFEYQFHEFELFLKIRENSDLLEKLEDIAKLLNREILSKRSGFANTEFQVIIQNLANTLIEDQYNDLRGEQKSIFLVLYFIYSKCLLGKKTKGEKLNAIVSN